MSMTEGFMDQIADGEFTERCILTLCVSIQGIGKE